MAADSTELGVAERSSDFARVVGPLLSVLLAVVLPGVVILGEAEQSASYWWACWLISAYAGIRLSLLVATGRQQLYRFTFLLYVYMFLGLAPMAQLRRGQFPSVAPWVDFDDVPVAISLIIAGLLAYEVGVLLAGARTSAGGSHRIPQLAIPRVSGFAVLSIIVSIAYIVVSEPSTFLQPRAEVFVSQAATFENSAIRGLLSSTSLGSLLVALVSCAAAFRLTRLNRYVLLGVTSGGLLLFTANVFNSPRYVAMVVIVSILGVFGIFATRARTRTAFVVAIGGLALVFPLLSNFRSSNSLGTSVPFVQSLRSGDYDSFAAIVNAVTVADASGFRAGEQLLGALLTWVPRSAWPDKPVSTSVVIAEGMGYTFTNVSSPLWAEWYIDFSFVGVVVGFVLFGIVTTKADQRLLATYDTNAFPGIVGFVLPFYMLILIRGSIMSTLPIFAVVLLGSALLARRGATELSRPPRFWGSRRAPRS